MERAIVQAIGSLALARQMLRGAHPLIEKSKGHPRMSSALRMGHPRFVRIPFLLRRLRL